MIFLFLPKEEAQEQHIGRVVKRLNLRFQEQKIIFIVFKGAQYQYLENTVVVENLDKWKLSKELLTMLSQYKDSLQTIHLFLTNTDGIVDVEYTEGIPKDINCFQDSCYGYNGITPLVNISFEEESSRLAYNESKLICKQEEIPQELSDEMVFMDYGLNRERRDQCIRYPYGILNRKNYFCYADTINDLGFLVSDDFQKYKIRDKDHKLIVLFGNSQMADKNHPFDETTSYLLQEMLNRHCKKLKFTVLNFAGVWHLINNSLSTYLLYVQNLNPDIVISHDGFTDIFAGLYADNILLEKYMVAYDLSASGFFSTTSKSERPYFSFSRMEQFPENSQEKVAYAYYYRKKQFEHIVKSFNTVFITGLQPVLFSKHSLSNYENISVEQSLKGVSSINNLITLTKKVVDTYNYYRDIRDTEQTFQYEIDFDRLFQKYTNEEFLFYDNVHVVSDTNQIFAETYLEKIKEIYKCGEWI